MEPIIQLSAIEFLAIVIMLLIAALCLSGLTFFISREYLREVWDRRGADEVHRDLFGFPEIDNQESGYDAPRKAKGYGVLED